MSEERTDTKEKSKRKRRPVICALALGAILALCPDCVSAGKTSEAAADSDQNMEFSSDSAEGVGDASDSGQNAEIIPDPAQNSESVPDPTRTLEPSATPEPTQSPEPTPTIVPSQAPQRIYVVIENPEESPFSDGTSQKNGGTEDEDGDSGSENASDAATESVQSSGSAVQTEEIIHQPKMLLEDTGLSGTKLEAGSSQTLQVSFTNTSASQSAYNLKVNVSADSESVVFQKNSYYISRVSPGETETLDLTISLAADAKAGSLPLTFSFEYEDKKGNALTGTEKLILLAEQSSAAELAETDFPGVVYDSDTVELTLGARNTGRSAIYNARITLDGDGMSPAGEVYLGNLEAGASGSGTMRIYVGSRTAETDSENGTDSENVPETQNASEAAQQKTGAVTGTITLHYEDASGETHEVTKEYQTEIKEAKVLSLKVDEEEPEANSWWISVFAVIIAGLGAMLLILAWRLRRKNILLKEARGEYR